MKREEALKLIGTLVHGYTSFRGSYIGELVEVKESRPWRGVIRVLMVAEIPMGAMARIIRAGETLEVGGVNVAPFTGELRPWRESVELLLKKQRLFLTQWEEQHAQSPHPMWGEAGGIAHTRRLIENAERQLAASQQSEASPVG